MTKYQNKGAANCVICQPSVFWENANYFAVKGMSGALSAVPNDAVLLIDGHGSSISSKGRVNTGWAQYGNSPVIAPSTDWNTNNTTALTTVRLAALIEREGLSKNHLAIRMLTCYGAGASASYKGWNVVNNIKSALAQRDHDTGGHFAKDLAKQLSARGYKNIVVGGYRGPVVNSTTSGRTTVRVDDLSGSGTRVNAGSDKQRYMAW